MENFDPIPESTFENQPQKATNPNLIRGYNPAIGACRPQDSRGRDMRQLLEMQRVVHYHVLNDATSPQDKASLIRSWDLLIDRKRILRGHLKAGSVNESRKGPDANQPALKSARAKILDIASVTKAMKETSEDPSPG